MECLILKATLNTVHYGTKHPNYIKSFQGLKKLNIESIIIKINK